MRTLRNLRSVLSSVRSGSALQSVSITIRYSDQLSYMVDRTGLLDDLLKSDMVAILAGFPELRQLHLTLHENDEEHDSQWWAAEMVRRLPYSCRVAVSVEVQRSTASGMLCFATCPATILLTQSAKAWRNLWHTPEETEMAKRAGENSYSTSLSEEYVTGNAEDIVHKPPAYAER